MRKWTKVLLGFLILITVSVQVGFLLPFWVCKFTAKKDIRIDNSQKDICCNTVLSKRELFSSMDSLSAQTTVIDAVNEYGIRFFRRTPKGYYAIIRTCDEYLFFIFFDNNCFFDSFIYCKYFCSREDAAQYTVKIEWSEYEGYDSPVALSDFDTGAKYCAAYYTDGFDVIEYTSVPVEGPKDKILYVQTHRQQFSYCSIRYNPLYLFDPVPDLLYILQCDINQYKLEHTEEISVH